MLIFYILLYIVYCIQNIQYVQVTLCTSKITTITTVLFPSITVYQEALFVIAIAFTLFVPARAPSLIKFDLAMMRIALGFIAVLEVVFLAAQFLARGNPFLMELVWGFEVIRTLLGTILFVCVLFMYQVSLYNTLILNPNPNHTLFTPITLIITLLLCSVKMVK